MLFSPVEANKPIRIQGPYISETESAAVIDFVKIAKRNGIPRRCDSEH